MQSELIHGGRCNTLLQEQNLSAESIKANIMNATTWSNAWNQNRKLPAVHPAQVLALAN